MNPRPSFTLDRLRELHARGLTPVAIAAQLGAEVTPAAVRAALEEAGLVPNQRARSHAGPGRAIRGPRQPIDGALAARSALLRMAARRVAAGASVAAVAKDLGLLEEEMKKAVVSRSGQHHASTRGRSGR